MPDIKPPVELRSEEIQDILAAIPHWMIRWGSMIIFIILLGIVFLSWIIKYPDSVAGEAVFTTTKEPVYIYAKTNGNLTNLYVREGEHVEKGQLLAEINNPVQKEHIDYLQAKLIMTDSLLERGKPEAILFDSQEPFFGEVQINYNKLKESINNFKQLQSSYYQSSVKRMKDNIVKYRQLADIYGKKLAISQRELTNAEQRFQIDQQLYKERVIASVDLIDKETLLNQKRMELEDLRQAIVLNQLALTELEKQLQEQLFNQEESGRKMKETILSEKKILESFILSWKQGFAITSPSEGRAVFIEKFSEGFYLNPDKPLFAILPLNEKFIAKVKVPSSRYGKIKEGQRVRFELDNYPFQEYGYLYGTVQKKSYIPIEKEYELLAELPTDLVSSYGQEIIYEPDMIGTAEVIIEDQRLIEKVFYSFRKLLKS